MNDRSPETGQLSVLVVDDEPAARSLLRGMLERVDDVVISGECQNGLEALAALSTNPIDIVFLDVRMPELDGVELAEHLLLHTGTAVVFVTAYEEFAVRAFGVQAWDYLLKPFDEVRLHETLARVRQRMRERRAAAPPAAPGDSPHRKWIAVRKGRAHVMLRTEDLDWVHAESNYVSLHVGREAYLARVSLTELEERLDPRSFVRIHRSALVNIDRIDRLEPRGHGDMLVTLKDGQQLNLSRRYRKNMERAIEALR